MDSSAKQDKSRVMKHLLNNKELEELREESREESMVVETG